MLVTKSCRDVCNFHKSCICLRYNVIMEMELCQGEIQAHCTDLKDGALALVRSALFTRSIPFIKKDLELITYNTEQSITLSDIISDIMHNLTDYYYAAGEHYSEHPYYLQTITEGQIIDSRYYYDDNPIFKVKYEKLSDTTTKILFSIKDKEKCIEALDEYCLSYGYDVVFSNEDNILTCEAQDKRLYKLLTADDYNLNNFVVKDLKYIKAICYNEYLKKIGISDIEIGFDSDNKLTLKCIISAQEFVEKYGKDTSVEDNGHTPVAKTNKTQKTRKHFAPSVQDLYDYIKKYAPAKNFEIYKQDLIGEDRRNKLYCGMGELTTAVNRLNKQYKEISNSDITLMKYDKFLDCYKITDIWNN